MTLKRRQFLTGGATALAAGAVASPAIAQGAPEIKWRLTSSFPRILDTIFGTAQTIRQIHRRGDRQPVPDPDLSGRRDRARAAGARRGAERLGRVRADAGLLLFRQGPDARVRHRRAVRTQRAAFSIPGGISAAAPRSSTRCWRSSTRSGFRSAIPAARWADSSARRSTTSRTSRASSSASAAWAGRCWPSSASCRSRSRRATFIRRSKRERSTPPSSSAPTTTRSSGSTRSPSTTITPAGGKAAR